MHTTRAVLVTALLVLAAGCKESNPNYCPDQPGNLCVDGGGIDSPVSCDDSRPCAVGICDNNVCVECVDNTQCTSDPLEPVCTAGTNTCGGCTKHDDCASEVCLPSGACAATDTVSYVHQGGMDGAECTLATPCATVTHALSTSATKAIIKIKGAIADNGVSLDDRDLAIFGEPQMPNKAVLTRSGNNEVIKIDGNGTVAIWDLEIAEGSGSNGIGIAVLGGFTGTLACHRMKVVGNSAIGIDKAGSGSFTLSQSEVGLNGAGGIRITGGSFTLTNNVIYRNGNGNTSQFGGVDIQVASGTSSRLEFNTIADNDSAAGSARTGGVWCDIPGFDASNNIVARNRVANTATLSNSQVFGVCSHLGSLVQNDVTGLSFSSSELQPYSYRLMPGSSAIDRAMTPTTVTVDIDDQPRPNGSASDMGADEYYSPM